MCSHVTSYFTNSNLLINHYRMHFCIKSRLTDVYRPHFWTKHRGEQTLKKPQKWLSIWIGSFWLLLCLWTLPRLEHVLFSTFVGQNYLGEKNVATQHQKKWILKKLVTMKIPFITVLATFQSENNLSKSRNQRLLEGTLTHRGFPKHDLLPILTCRTRNSTTQRPSATACNLLF